jgi:hypothetical protein
MSTLGIKFISQVYVLLCEIFIKISINMSQPQFLNL